MTIWTRIEPRLDKVTRKPIKLPSPCAAYIDHYLIRYPDYQVGVERGTSRMIYRYRVGEIRFCFDLLCEVKESVKRNIERRLNRMGYDRIPVDDGINVYERLAGASNIQDVDQP